MSEARAEEEEEEEEGSAVSEKAVDNVKEIIRIRMFQSLEAVMSDQHDDRLIFKIMWIHED